MPMLYDTAGATVRFVPGMPDTSAAAELALREQQPGDEFKPQANPEIERMQRRLEEIDNEVSKLYVKLWGPPNSNPMEYDGPPFLESERIQKRIRELDAERYSLQCQLRDTISAYAMAAPEVPVPNGRAS